MRTGGGLSMVDLQGRDGGHEAPAAASLTVTTAGALAMIWHDSTCAPGYASASAGHEGIATIQLNP